MAECGLFCFGYGYVAQKLASDFTRMGRGHVGGTVRDPLRLSKSPVALNLYGADVTIPSAYGCALISIPPHAQGCPVLADYGAALADSHTGWVGYLSTTGVYGDAGGAWVDEDSPLLSQEPHGRNRILAERQWLDWGEAHGKKVTIFRLSGIYGPGRSIVDDLRIGTARRIEKPGHVFCRIHVQDIVQTILAAMDHSHNARVYNLADDEPSSSGDVVAYAARLLGLTPPPLENYDDVAAELSPMRRSFYAACRRVRNDRIKSELGIRLHYPTYREGLTVILAEEHNPICML